MNLSPFSSPWMCGVWIVAIALCLHAAGGIATLAHYRVNRNQVAAVWLELAIWASAAVVFVLECIAFAKFGFWAGLIVLAITVPLCGVIGNGSRLLFHGPIFLSDDRESEWLKSMKQRLRESRN